MLARRGVLRRARNACVVVAVAAAVTLWRETYAWTPGARTSGWAGVARGALFASAIGVAVTVTAMRACDRANGVGNVGVGGGRGVGGFGVDAGARTTTWNGSAWTASRAGGFASGAAPARVEETDAVQGTGAFGYGGYQDGVDFEDARERAERERAEQERWARWEAEDEEREARRASERAEKKAEDKAKKEKSRAKRWMRYDELWEALDANASSSEPLRYDDVPWPPKTKDLLEREAGGPEASDRDKKLAYHRCVKRWHPDKFLSKFRARIDAGGDRARIQERVDAIAKAITAARGDA